MEPISQAYQLLCLDPEFLHIPSPPFSLPPMIPAQDTIWTSLEQLPARSPGFHPQPLLCFSLSGQRIPVNTQVRSRPSSSAQDLCGFLLTQRKSPSPPRSPQGPACSAQSPPCPPLLPFTLPPTALTLLQAPWPGCSSNTQGTLQPQSLCTCCFHSLEYSSLNLSQLPVSPYSGLSSAVSSSEALFEGLPWWRSG